jgi:hypothetical protein
LYSRAQTDGVTTYNSNRKICLNQSINHQSSLFVVGTL